MTGLSEIVVFNVGIRIPVHFVLKRQLRQLLYPTRDNTGRNGKLDVVCFNRNNVDVLLVRLSRLKASLSSIYWLAFDAWLH